MEAKSSTSYLTVDDVIMPRVFPLYSIKIQTECADQFSSGDRAIAITLFEPPKILPHAYLFSGEIYAEPSKVSF